MCLLCRTCRHLTKCIYLRLVCVPCWRPRASGAKIYFLRCLDCLRSFFLVYRWTCVTGFREIDVGRVQLIRYINEQCRLTLCERGREFVVVDGNERRLATPVTNLCRHARAPLAYSAAPVRGPAAKAVSRLCSLRARSSLRLSFVCTESARPPRGNTTSTTDANQQPTTLKWRCVP